MKTKIVIPLLLIVLVGCINEPPQKSEIKKTKTAYSGNDYESCVRTYEYDSCEYVCFSTGNNRWGGHKGNCKFCIERSKRK